MKVTVLFILTIVLACTFHTGHAQSGVAVSTPELSFTSQGGVQISYDILNTLASENFFIRLEVSDSKGRLINARSLEGDVGPHVPGGSNKRIIWDIGSDSIFLDEEIFVQVYARKEAPQKMEETPVLTETIAKENSPPGDDPLTKEVNPTDNSVFKEESGSRTLNRTFLIFQSVLFPGLGLSRVNKGQPHWIKGVAGYGCIAGAIYFNSKAISTYDAYRNSDRLDQVDEIYNRAVRQDVTSEILAYAAIGIWVTDLVWTIVGTSDLKGHQSSSINKGISVGTSVEPLSAAPMIAFRYRF